MTEMKDDIKKLLLDNNTMKFIIEYDLFNMYDVCHTYEDKKECTCCKMTKPTTDFVNVYCNACYKIYVQYRGLVASLLRKNLL